MAKSLTFILVALMALALMLFTASRTLDLLQLLLPANQSVFAYLGLVAFDGGLLGWSLFFGETIIFLEWYELAGVKLARIKRVSKQEKKEH